MFHIFLIVAFLFHFVIFLRCIVLGVLVVLACYSFSVLLLLLVLRLLFIAVGSTLFFRVLLSFFLYLFNKLMFFVLFMLRFFS